MRLSPLLQVGEGTESEPSLVSGVQTVSNGGRGGAYSVQVSREMRHWELAREPTLFECVLSIPGTDYENQRKIIYFPGTYLPLLLLYFFICIGF